MPERLAAAKLKGFVDDYGGKVIASEPGLIRIQLGVPERPKEKPAGSAIFRWLRTVTTPPTTVPEGQEPIELELHMEKPDPSQPKLNVLVTCPAAEGLPANQRRLLAGSLRQAEHHPSPVPRRFDSRVSSSPTVIPKFCTPFDSRLVESPLRSGRVDAE